ncbi:hypothetical protein [Acidianus sp. HS-5]|nr:hypothetical protein [Acidianus sp. HS-5]
MSTKMDPCIEECYSPRSAWKYVTVEECLRQCRTIEISKVQ